MQAARAWNSVWRNAVAKTLRRKYHGIQHKVHMNQMPVPEGDFFAHHAKRQQGHHIVLATGLAMWGFGIFMYNATDIVNFHFDPPKNID